MTEKELLKVFGSNIRLYRTRFKWSQAELAEKINISINFLSDIENSKKWASPITTVKFADVFNINVYELFKPPDTFPENCNNVIEKFAEDMHSAVERVRTTLLKNDNFKHNNKIKKK
jgi:transcriptional regulator with XRE-family HTH domain